MGSGPAGMHAALLLANKGFSATIFEKEASIGGMLRYYLPEFRMSRGPLEGKRKALEKAGVEIKTNTPIGKEKPLQGLVDGFDAVVLACGEWKARKLGVKGEKLRGIHYWTGFLRAFNEGKQERLDGKKAIVIGGGNTAIDCARAAKRLGAETRIVYRRSREKMPAGSSEIEAAEREGIKIYFQLSPMEFLGNEMVEKAVFERTVLRENRMEKTAEKVEMETGFVVIAVGQQADNSVLGGSSFNSFGELPEKVFLAGDIANKEKKISAAIKSAEAIAGKISQTI